MKNTVKTTIEIDKKLFYDVKKKLLNSNMTLRDTVHISLQNYVYSERNLSQPNINISSAIQKTFGSVKPLQKPITDAEMKDIIKEERAKRDRKIVQAHNV